MTPDALFAVCMRVAMLGWLLLIALPRWRWTTGLITSVVVPAMMATVYAFLVIPRIERILNGFGSVASISALFQDPAVMVAGWVHYLAFDLFVGTWEVDDSRRLGIHHLLVVPCLMLTLMAGPLGFLLYLLIRLSRRRLLVSWGSSLA